MVGPSTPATKRGFSGVLRFHGLRRFPRQFGPGKIQLIHQILHVVIRHRGSGGVERIGLDDIRAGFQIGLMDGTDDLRLGERQKIVIAFEIVRKIGEARAAIIRFVELVALDHGAHGAIQQQNAACEEVLPAISCGEFRSWQMLGFRWRLILSRPIRLSPHAPGAGNRASPKACLI